MDKNIKKPICFMLSGLPGSGKSTWISENNDQLLRGYDIISTDKFIEQHAEFVGSDYNQVFDEYFKTAKSLMNSELDDCIANKRNIVWDQTNLTKKSRKGKISRLKGYDVYAVVFEVPEKVLEYQLSARHETTGKYISKKVIENMSALYERPDLDEGFTNVILIKREYDND